MYLNERKQLIGKYGRCFVCSKKGHVGKNCLSTNNCNPCGNDTIGLFVRVLVFLLTLFSPIIPLWVRSVESHRRQHRL